MDKIAQEDNSLQTERELTLPPSVKQPRTHCTVTNDHSGESRFDFEEGLTFRKTTDFPSSKGILLKNVILVCTTENGDIQDEKPYEQLQDTKLIIAPITKVTTFLSDDSDLLLSKVCVISAERHLVHLGKDKQSPVSESDKLCSYLPDEAGEALVEPHTSNTSSADTSSHPDCKWLGKSLGDKTLVGCCLFTENDKDARQVQHSVSQIQAFTLSSRDEEVRCQSDCSNEHVLHDAGFCDTWSQSAEVEVSNQKRDEHAFCENILFGKEEQEGNSSISGSHYADCKLNYSYPKEDHMGDFARDLKNEEKILHLHIWENENVAVCDGETKGQVNENGMSKNSILSVAECTEVSVVPYDVLLARNAATENVRLEIDDLCGIKGEYAAGKMIVRAWNETADHTTEAPTSARISQEPAEEDNNAGLYSVMDPAIWSETDREAEEKHCNSASTAGIELSPSIKVCEMEVPPPLCFDVRTSQKVSAPNQIRQFYHQSITQQCRDEKEDLCQSYTEPKACSITTNETHNMTGNQSSSPCSPTKLPLAGDGRQGSHSTVGLLLKEQDQFDSLPISLDNVRTQEAEQSQAEISRMDWITTITEREDMTSFEEIKTDEHMNLETVVESEEELLQQNELHKADTACDWISDWTEGEISECDDRLTCVEDELEKKVEHFSDHSYSVHVSMMVETTVEKERKEVKDVGEERKTDGYENSEIAVKSEDDLQQHDEDKTDTIDVTCMSDWTEDNMITSGNKLTLVSQHEIGNNLSSCPDYQHRAETCMVENTDDLVAFTSPPTSDAVVPCQNDSSHSQNANSPTTLNCSGRFSPVPSACILYNWVSGGLDTFEKIQLLPVDDSDNDVGLGNTSVLTSLPGQLLKTPQRQLSHNMPEAKTDGYDQALDQEEKEEEEVEEECHTEYMANGFLNSDTSCNDVPNFISATDVIALGWPEQQPNCESTCDSCEPIKGDLNTQSKSSAAFTESDSSASEVNEYPEFEMKKQFDMVLKELNLFFDISISDFASERALLPEQGHDITEPLEADYSDCKEPLSSPHTGCHRNTSTGDC